MRQPEHLTLRPHRHPDPAVEAGGFSLGDAYLRQCWRPILGEPATLLLERLPALWQRTGIAGFERSLLADSLGLPDPRPWRKPLERVLDRLVEYGFAEWVPFVDRGIPRHGRGELGVYTRVSPLGDLDLERVPPAVRAKHDELAKPVLDRAFPSGLVADVPIADRARYLATPPERAATRRRRPRPVTATTANHLRTADPGDARPPSHRTASNTRDATDANPEIPGHTLAGSPPGNLLGPSRQRRR